MKDENGGAVKCKRSKPEGEPGEEVVYHPVKMSRSDLYRPPTAEELNQLKEAESLFHCSLLKMQVRSLSCPHDPKQENKKPVVASHVPLSHLIFHPSSPSDGGASERGCLE